MTRQSVLSEEQSELLYLISSLSFPRMIGGTSAGVRDIFRVGGRAKFLDVRQNFIRLLSVGGFDLCDDKIKILSN